MTLQEDLLKIDKFLDDFSEVGEVHYEVKDDGYSLEVIHGDMSRLKMEQKN